MRFLDFAPDKRDRLAEPDGLPSPIRRGAIAIQLVIAAIIVIAVLQPFGGFGITVFGIHF